MLLNFLNFGESIEVIVGLFGTSLYKLRPVYCIAENKKAAFFPGLLLLITPEDRRGDNRPPQSMLL